VRLTQGCFSFLPDLTNEQIEKQVAYAMSKGWAMNVEWTDDPHPRNSYWELWGLPLFDIKDPASVMFELNKLVNHVQLVTFVLTHLMLVMVQKVVLCLSSLTAQLTNQAST
jgi:ribulose bisphosphate carboxylase small subunit